MIKKEKEEWMDGRMDRRRENNGWMGKKKDGQTNDG